VPRKTVPGPGRSSDDRVEDSGDDPALDDDAAEHGRGRDLGVVVDRVAIAADGGEPLDVLGRHEA
jgi:hypothetical protein